MGDWNEPLKICAWDPWVDGDCQHLEGDGSASRHDGRRLYE